MACPIGYDLLPKDCAMIEPRHNKVIVQSRVYAVVSPDEAHYPPFSDYFTVSLYPSKGKVKYLKFRTREERDVWHFKRDESYIVHGCLHKAGGMSLNGELIFDVTRVERTG